MKQRSARPPSRRGEALIPARGIGSLPVQFSQQGAALLPRSPQFGVPCIIGRSRHHLCHWGHARRAAALLLRQSSLLHQPDQGL